MIYAAIRFTHSRTKLYQEFEVAFEGDDILEGSRTITAWIAGFNTAGGVHTATCFGVQNYPSQHTPPTPAIQVGARLKTRLHSVST